ncbi:GAF domain-containing sensor histidine kinase [Paucibacter sp. AS339]|uniref:GAF domain-containing sensor histidine kinase n=1 Tax=Paucibacter hankyongi TaxID=3133434 RepID=UPI00309E4EEF
MEFFPADASIAAWEQQLALGAPLDTVQERLQLAWGLRQRDTRRALVLVTDVEGLLGSTDWPALRLDAARGRLHLVRSEAHLLHGELAQAERQLDLARALFEAAADQTGLADVHWQSHYLAADRGDVGRLRAELAMALGCAEAAGDTSRATVFQANLGRSQVFVDQVLAEREWGVRLPLDSSNLAPMEGSAVEDFRGLLAAMQGNFLSGIQAHSKAFELAMLTGQIRRAITLATNLGHTYTKMSDFQTAMEWLKRGLDLARGSRWPSMISLCLAHTGEALRRLGQLGDARDLLQECLQLCAAQPDNRTRALALNFLGHTELNSDRGVPAHAAFTELMERAVASRSLDLRTEAQLGLARAELMLGHFELARGHAEEGLRLAREQHEPNNEVDMLWVLGDVQQAEDSALGCSGSHGRALGSYLAALQLAEGMESYQPSMQLLEATAKAFADGGNFERAYHWSQRASAARQHSFNEEAMRRSSALRVHHQIESARAESEHLRRLAESEAARFQLLRDTHEVLQHLGQVGQEITNELVAERIFEVMTRHVNALLDAPCLAIYLLDAAGRQLYCAYGIENGEPFTDPPIEMSSERSLCVRCVQERKEILFSDAAEQEKLGEHVPGTSQQLSLIFAPLLAGERVIGAMTIQSPRAKAYGERQQLIFRTLRSYIAIALDNAGAYLRLSQMQRQLMAQEKLAALGSMVAGVAHELNTPIGNSLLIASTLLGSTQEFVQRVEQQALKRSDWEQYAGRTRDGLEVINRSMETAAALVRSFKQVAVDRSAEQRRSFDLRELCEQCAQTMGLQLRRAGVRLALEVPAGLQLDSFPGPLGQVLIILINNALVHAFEGRKEGLITLGAQAQQAGRLSLWVADDGLGIPPSVQERIFDPFFTTKFGQGGSGLGLSIAHNISGSLLGGGLSVTSREGEGSRFVIEMPFKAP